MDDKEKQTTDATEMIAQGLNSRGGGGTTAATPPIKPAAETPGEQQPNAEPQTAAPPAGFISREEAAKMIADGVKQAMETQTGQREQADTRERFLRANLSDLPIRFHELMPKTGDLKELAQAEQEIREDFKNYVLAYAKKMGINLVRDTASPPGGEAPKPRQLDNSKVSATQLIAEGLSEKRNQ